MDAKSFISQMGRAGGDRGSDLYKVTQWVQRVEPELPAPSPEPFSPPSRRGVLECPCYEGKFPVDSRRTLIIIRLLGQCAVEAWMEMLLLPLAGLRPQPSHLFPPLISYLQCGKETELPPSRIYYEHQRLTPLPSF